MNTSHSAATLEWRIPEITYDPEMYRVEFGTIQTILNMTSTGIAGSNELTTTNQRYTVELNGLLPEATYYYRVVSTNSYASTSSAVASFVTTQLRMFLHVYMTVQFVRSNLPLPYSVCNAHTSYTHKLIQHERYLVCTPTCSC